MVALARAGVPADEVVAAASWRGREWLGRPGLEEGAPADFLVVDADPCADVDTLRRPRRLVLDGAVLT
jgi:imidazolonepropionase-like amidohydrolase